MQKVERLIFLIFLVTCDAYRKKEDKTKCPQVKGLRNFDLQGILGSWHVVQYYATSEEDVVYKCMRAVFTMPGEGMEIEMNVTYSFVDDPDDEKLTGNITWTIPDLLNPSHWVHAEDIYEGVYNAYIIDCDSQEWALLLHCAEKPKSPRYLTSMMLSRGAALKPNVISFLRDKLPRYDISLEYMFEMNQENCDDPQKSLHYGTGVSSGSIHKKMNKHPLKRRTKSIKNTP